MNININIDISEMYASATRKKIVKLGGRKLSTSVLESYQLKRRLISKQQQRVSVGLRKVVKEANILLHCIYVLCMLMVVKFASNLDHLRREL